MGIYNSGHGKAIEPLYEDGFKTGGDFPIGPGEGLIIYGTRDKMVAFTSLLCPEAVDFLEIIPLFHRISPCSDVRNEPRSGSCAGGPT